MSEIVINFVEPTPLDPAAFGEAFRRFHANMNLSTERMAALAQAMEIVNAIAALVPILPRHALGWTRRKWDRMRRRFNAERRRHLVRVVAAPLTGEDEMLDKLREIGASWRAVMHEPQPPARSFSEYVGQCIAEGRVPMRGGIP